MDDRSIDDEWIDGWTIDRFMNKWMSDGQMGHSDTVKSGLAQAVVAFALCNQGHWVELGC